MPTPQKESTVADISETLRAAQGVIFTDYRGLSVSQITDLRRKLRESGAEYSVVKNTLFRRATEGIIDPDPQIDETLNGPTAAAFVQSDPVATAKVLVDYIANNRNTPLAIKGGIVGGKFYTTDQVNALSKVPPREVLIAQMLGSFNAPITGLVGTLNGILSNFVFTLQAIVDKQGGASAGGGEAAA